MKNIIYTLFFIPFFGITQNEKIYDFEIKSKNTKIELGSCYLYPKCLNLEEFSGDLFSNFSTNEETLTLFNEYGRENSLNGNTYAGFFGYKPGRDGEKERTYITIKLDEPLIKDKIYEITWDISLAEKSKWTVNNVGIMFSETPNPNTAPILSNDVVFDHKTRYLTNSFGWDTHGATYVAKGNEKYLTFGNFSKNEFYKYKLAKLETVKNNDEEFDQEDFAYYYIDNIQFKEIAFKKESSFYSEYEPKMTFIMGALDDPKWDDIAKIEAQTIYFSHNKTNINSNTQTTLDFLVQLLLKNPELNLMLFVSLDELEQSKETNLSELRSSEVISYLRNKNVKNNITFKNKNENEFDEDKEVYYAKNRKINFKIM